jgi:hypothetical protein
VQLAQIEFRLIPDRSLSFGARNGGVPGMSTTGSNLSYPMTSSSDPSTSESAGQERTDPNESATSSASAVQGLRTVTASMFRRVFAKLRAGQDSTQSAEPVSVSSGPTSSVLAEPEPLSTVPPTSAPPGKSEPVSIKAHTPIPSEADNDPDEVEVLLRRASEMVGGHPPPLGDEAPEVPPTSGTSMRVVSNEIVQNSHHPREKAAYTSPDTEVAPTELSGSMGAERARTSRMVQIQYDPNETAYVARDSESGLIVMRHKDCEHLRDVCEWIGWRVVDGGMPGS